VNDGTDPEPETTETAAAAPAPSRPLPPSLKRRMTFLAIGCVLAALLAIGLFGPFGSSSPAVKLPASLPALHGGPAVRLPQLGTKLAEPVVITFFASWCTPCEAEIPAVARYARAEANKGARVTFIGVDESDSSAAGLGFVKRAGVGFSVGADPDGNVLEDLGAEAALPQTIFIDTSGQIIHHVYGSVTAGSTLQTWVGHLLST
jgi:thiol-disulfide isomerase/thioredoxin